MFKPFAQLVSNKFNEMSHSDNLFVVAVDPDVLYDQYLDAFPEGTNEIFRVRRSHDCGTCRNFIKNVGGIVTIGVNLELTSVWDIVTDDIKATPYVVVAKKMSEFVKSHMVSMIFLSKNHQYGKDKNIEFIEDKPSITWNHFYALIDDSCMPADMGKAASEKESAVGVFERTLNGKVNPDGDDELPITMEAIDIVLDLIESNNLHRGAENLDIVKSLAEHITAYSKLEDDVSKNRYIWRSCNMTAVRLKVRNTSIGTLLVDLTEGKDVANAVVSYEHKVSNGSFKRKKALATPKMVDAGIDALDKKGYRESIPRRYATLSDLSATNTHFVDRNIKPLMKDPLKELLSTPDMQKPSKVPKTFAGIVEIHIDDFLKDVLPGKRMVELFMTNGLVPNLTSLIAPVNPDAKSLFQWDNPYSLSYKGNFAGSMKADVAAFGGKTDGYFRFSILWNDEIPNMDDLDAHCVTPSKGHIYHATPVDGTTQGELDVDVRVPDGKAVENITFPSKDLLEEGRYTNWVENYDAVTGTNRAFHAEIEYEGKLHQFFYPAALENKEKVLVAALDYSKETGFTMIESLDGAVQQNVTAWGLNTGEFQRVNAVFESPNHWGEVTGGNRHIIFSLDGCNNTEEANGFYGENLTADLREESRVLEMLSGKMKCAVTTNQVSGVGFSMTQRDSAIVKVWKNMGELGTFDKPAKMMKINF